MQFARISYYPLKFFLVVITPFAFIVNLIINSIMTFFPFIKKEKVFDTEEELKIATELGEADGTIEEDESEMIQSVLEFDNKMVREIMTPRVDISSISSGASIDDLMDLIKEKKYSKIPMYDESIDKIKGIIYAKDVLPYLIGSRPEKINISDFCKDALFIPENKPIDDMLEEFRSKKTQIAIIVDEWGGTAGLVTVEDIVEEVFGEIRDPYDIENDLFIKRTDNHYLLDAKIGIYDIEEELDIDFPEDRDYDTLGGYIFFSLGKIPEVKEFVSFGKWNFEVKSIVDNRIKKVEAKRKL
jgi:CBS domain containing-hemolysin-like protein